MAFQLTNAAVSWVAMGLEEIGLDGRGGGEAGGGEMYWGRR